MRRYRRQRATPKRTYSLARLLSRQPKSLEKNPDYPLMLSHYRTSERLRRLRITRRCYSLLDRAVITPENLRNFYRTYRLPADPFFPLFFSIKRAYLDHRVELKKQREQYILDSMRSLPPDVRAAITYLGRLERAYNAAELYPVWQSHLLPKTKKRAREYSRLETAQWIELFEDHLALLAARYRSLSPSASPTAGRLLACFSLGFTLDAVPPRWPSPADVNRAYRRLSLLHHPDRGGDPARFLAIKRARDTLLGNR